MSKENVKKLAKIITIAGVVIFFAVLALVLGLTFANKENKHLDMSNAYTYTDEYGDWTYTVSGTNATITKFTGTATNVVIPSTITEGGTTYTVTALYDASSSSGAVFNGYGAKDPLISVTIPSTLKSIGNYAFYYCTGLTRIRIPNSVTSIGNSAFYSCSGVTDLTIGTGISSVSPWSFAYCSGLSTVSIPSNITSIGEYAFAWCSGLASITISNRVTSIENYAFYSCSGLTDVTIPNSVTSIGWYAFEYCRGLTSVTIGSGVKKVGACAFHECSKLLEIINKSSLTITAGSLKVSSSIENNDYLAYYAKRVITDASQSNYQVIDNIKYYINSSNNEYIAVGSTIANPTSITINNSCTSIYQYAFYNRISLVSVEIPDSVISIGDYAFSSCTSLVSVETPDSVTSIGSGAFYSCSGLMYLTISNNITMLNKHIFYKCTSLKSVIIPNRVTYIGEESFYECRSLMSITIGTSVTRVSRRAFSGCSKLLEVINKSSLTVTPGSSMTSGSVDYDYLGYYAKQVISDASQSNYQVINNVIYYIDICNNEYIAVALDGSPTSITINNGCMKINSYAFYECSDLTNIEIPSSVTSIGWYAFSSCIGLTSVTIPNSVTSIGDYAFWCCSGLTSVTIPNRVTSIGGDAFRGCTGLTSVTIPNSVTSIGSYAFQSCTGLTSVYFLHDYSSGVQTSSSSNPNYMSWYAFTAGNSNVKYYFINQASRDNAYNITYTSGSTTYDRSMFFTGSNFEVMTPQFNIEVNNSDWGSVTGNTNLAIGESTTLTPTPNTGYGFKYWLKNGESFDNNNDNTLTVTYTEYVIYTAIFDINYTISTSVLNNDYGTIMGGGTYLKGTEISLIATPNEGYAFVKWLKDNEEFTGNIDNPLTIIIVENVTYTAVFDRIYTITTNSSNNNYGSVTGGGIYLNGSDVILIATPNAGCALLKWQKNDVDFNGNMENPLTIIVTENATYTAIFKPLYTISTSVNNLVYGSVTGGGAYIQDAIVTLTISSNYGYKFIKWQKDGQDFIDNTTTSIEVVVVADVMYTAILEKESFTIITNVNNASYGSVTYGNVYQYLDVVTFTATPNTGYVFIKWLKNNEEFTGNTANPLTITVTGNDTYTAVLDIKYCTISSTQNLTPTIGSVNDISGTYQEGTQLTLTATPNTGAKFFYWLKNGQTFTGSLSNPLTITVTEDVTYTVCFAPEDYNPQIRSPYSVMLEYEYQGAETVNPEVCGRLTTYCYGDFDNKTTVRVEAIATSGYCFVGWKINGESTVSRNTPATKQIFY